MSETFFRGLPLALALLAAPCTSHAAVQYDSSVPDSGFNILPLSVAHAATTSLCASGNDSCKYTERAGMSARSTTVYSHGGIDNFSPAMVAASRQDGLAPNGGAPVALDIDGLDGLSEPSSMVLLITGFALLGGALRGSKRIATRRSRSGTRTTA